MKGVLRFCEADSPGSKASDENQDNSELFFVFDKHSVAYLADLRQSVSSMGLRKRERCHIYKCFPPQRTFLYFHLTLCWSSRTEVKAKYSFVFHATGTPQLSTAAKKLISSEAMCAL